MFIKANGKLRYFLAHHFKRVGLGSMPVNELIHCCKMIVIFS